MGEMDNNGLQFFYNGKPIRQGDFGCGHITKPSPSHAERMASLKAEVDAMAEKYKPVIDKLMDEIYESSQKPIELLSEETAQQITKAFENIQKTMEKNSPMAFAKRKTRKHYKPKFTL
ncbi:MAG: hypothetical protein J6V21_09460 [Alistipes sp.]|nr:hypothetical protein [Alistipes sp.]